MRRWVPGLTTQIVLALLLGVLLGTLWPVAGQRLELLATLFLRLVLMIIAPLIFASLVVGIAGSKELKQLSGLAAKAVLYFLVVTAVVMAIGFALGNLFQPGQELQLAAAAPASLPAPAEESFWVRLVPRSVIDAMARGDVLQIVVFSLLFGVALGVLGERGRPVRHLCESLAEVMYRLTDLVMRVAPLGVLGAIASLVGTHGLRVGESFLWFTLAVYAGLALVFFGLYPLLCFWFRIPIRELFRTIQEPFVIAFGTTSSAAALPRAMELMERFGVPRRAVAFVLPTGYSFNLAGSALFIGVSGLFVAQAYQVPLSLSDQMVLFGTLYVASKGVATVPRGSLIALAAGLSTFGMAPEVVGASFGLLLGIDPILDMPRTGVNITGNCLAAALVARWQGTLGERGQSC